MSIKQLIHESSLNPRKLFLADGLGAILSAFLLGVVLVELENWFGIPQSTLYFLAFLPCLFAAYDFYCYLKPPKKLGFFLKVIAIINLLYCILSISLAFYHHQKLTYLGWGYIVIEIMIVLILVYIEWKTANRLNSNQNNA